MDQLLIRLEYRFGCDKPILTEEILETWGEYSRPRVFQLIKKFDDEKKLVKYDTGVYYLPTVNVFGNQSVLSRKQVLEKKYVQDGAEVYGYYSGMSLLNSLGLTNQVPARPEVVSTKASAIVRKIDYGNLYAVVRKARTPINRENVAALELLEVCYVIPEYWINEETLEKIRGFVTEYNVKQSDVFKYAGAYPARATQNLMRMGVDNVFA